MDMGKLEASNRWCEITRMPENPSQCLIRKAQDTYGDSFSTDLLEQYKLYVQSAENVSARRVASSRYLLTLNAAFIALYGLQSASFGQSYWALLIPVIGIPVSVLWYQIIKSHASLNRVKFDVIHEFEQYLPAATYRYEWHLAEEGKGKTYRTISTLERWIPILFVGLHVSLAFMIILAIAGVTDWTTGLNETISPEVQLKQGYGH